MKPNFKEIIAFLENDPLAHLEVYNANTGDVIHKALNASLATTNSGSVTAYFEGILLSGIQEIMVIQKRKNGTSWKEKMCPFSYTLSRKQATIPPGAQSQPETVVTPVVKDPFGLSSAAQQMGLSQPQLMSMYSNAEKLPEVTKERNELRADVKKLKSDLDDERHKNLRHELGIEGKASAGEKLMDTLANPEVLTTVVSGITEAIAKAKAPGLANPAQQLQQLQTGCETKDALVKLITNAEVTEAMAISAYHLLSHALKGNQEFVDAFGALITKHNTLKTA